MERVIEIFEGRLLLKIGEVAKALNLAERTLYNQVSQGKCPIKVKRCGRALRFDVRDVMDYVDNL